MLTCLCTRKERRITSSVPVPMHVLRGPALVQPSQMQKAKQQKPHRPTSQEQDATIAMHRAKWIDTSYKKMFICGCNDPFGVNSWGEQL
jgi:hypothetical protein